MSLAGLRKQLNKANQFVNEKIGGVKGTELEDDFVEMERKIDISSKLIDDVITKTQEYLQPNPASRAKMTTMNTLHKLQGKAKQPMVYPQPEGTLGETMIKHGSDLGSNSAYGQALVEVGESFKQMAENKYVLEDQVKQNFLDPLHALQTRELKEIMHHRKKLQSRRLDYDCKKRKETKGSKLAEDEIAAAEEKFEESKTLAEKAMINFLNGDVEQIQALHEFVVSELEYHRQCTEILENLKHTLDNRKTEASGRPPKESTSQSETKKASEWSNSTNYTNASAPPSENLAAATPTFSMKPKYETTHQIATARALYDFEPQNSTELGFTEGDVIKLLQKVDDNWFEGEFKGKKGFFPVNYVEVIVPLKE